VRFSRSLFASLEIFALDHFFRPVSLLRFGRRRRSIPSSSFRRRRRRRRRRKDRRAPPSKRAEGRGESLRPTRSRRRRRRRRRERRRRKNKTPTLRQKRIGIGIARTMTSENCCFLLRAAAARRTRHGAVRKKRTLRARRRYRRRAKVTHASLPAINDDFAFCTQNDDVNFLCGERTCVVTFFKCFPPPRTKHRRQRQRAPGAFVFDDKDASKETFRSEAAREG